MRVVDLLRDLQELDSSLDRVRAELEEGRIRRGDDSELAPLRQEVEQARSRLHTSQESGKELEWDLDKETSKLKAEEKKLYGGTVKNPKELASLAQEVLLVKERVSRLEDDVLLNMDERESAAETSRRLEHDLAERGSAWNAAQAELARQCEEFERQTADLAGQRSLLVSRIDGASLKTYDLLRRTRGGLAVVPIEQRTCRGCRITLSSSEVQRARSSPDPVACQSCGRILYIAG